MDTYRFGFVMEQALGHRVYHRNLETWSRGDTSCEATWMSVPPWRDDRWNRLPLLNRNYSVRMSFRARDLVRARQAEGPPFDALFYHTFVSSLFNRGASRDAPVVISLDATPLGFDALGAGYGHEADAPGLASLLKLRWYKRLFNSAAAVTCWNRWSAESLMNDYDVEPSRISVIPPGADLGRWRPAHRDDRDDARPRLLFLGGEFERKGGRVLLDVFRSHLADRCELDIVSDEAPIESEGPIRVHRGVTHEKGGLKALFDAADVFVLPTRGDILPLAITEAMASGLPVVSCRVGAIHEQVVEGETGLLAPPNDPAALAKALASLLDDPARRRGMGIAGRLRAERLFNGPRNAAALMDFLKRVVDDARGHKAAPANRPIAVPIGGRRSTIRSS